MQLSFTFYKRLPFVLFILLNVTSVSSQIIKGYFPDYRSQSDANSVQYSKLTNLVYSIYISNTGTIVGNIYVNGQGNIQIVNSSVFNIIKSNCNSNNNNGKYE